MMQWFLSLYSISISDIEIVSRMWDSFLLEGEVYAFKVAIAILDFCQLELKIYNFNQTITLLKQLAINKDNSAYLFELIQNVQISQAEFTEILIN